MVWCKICGWIFYVNHLHPVQILCSTLFRKIIVWAPYPHVFIYLKYFTLGLEKYKQGNSTSKCNKLNEWMALPLTVTYSTQSDSPWSCYYLCFLTAKGEEVPVTQHHPTPCHLPHSRVLSLSQANIWLKYQGVWKRCVKTNSDSLCIPGGKSWCLSLVPPSSSVSPVLSSRLYCKGHKH